MKKVMCAVLALLMMLVAVTACGGGAAADTQEKGVFAQNVKEGLHAKVKEIGLANDIGEEAYADGMFGPYMVATLPDEWDNMVPSALVADDVQEGFYMQA